MNLQLLGMCVGLVSFLAQAAVEGRSLIKVDGSSTVYPITEAVAEEFQGSTKGAVKVTVGISGTGGGFKKFCRNETDIQDASRPISKEEMKFCRDTHVQYYELPVAYDAIAIVVSHKNTWLKSITVNDLKKMWEPDAQGKVTKWNQVRPEWPNANLKLFGAGSDSGTFDYFTEAVVGKAKASRGDYTASEDDNTLVQGIISDANALGYIPYAYYEANKNRLRVVPVDGGEKAPHPGPVAPSAQTVTDGTYYPLSRPIFIYVNATSSKRPEVKQFTEFYLKNGSNLVAQVKYIPLANDVYSKVLARFSSGKLGTAFGGEPQVGLRVTDILGREPKL